MPDIVNDMSMKVECRNVRSASQDAADGNRIGEKGREIKEGTRCKRRKWLRVEAENLYPDALIVIIWSGTYKFSDNHSLPLTPNYRRLGI